MKSLSSIRPLILAASLCAAFTAQARDLSLIRGDLENTGVLSSARGTARAIFTPHNPKFRLDLSGLTPNATYNFSVGGILEDTLTADRRGQVHKDFRLSGSAGKLSLDFDPRGKILSVNDGTAEVLSMMFSGDGEPDKMRVDERTTLTPVASGDRGRVEVRYLEQNNQDRFIMHFHGLERGDYQVFVDGQLQDEFSMNHGNSTMRVFRLWKGTHGNGNSHGKKKSIDLSFDPRGKVVDIVRDGAIVYTGEMLAKVDGLNEVKVGNTTVDLTSTGTDVDATGSAALALDEEGVLSLTVNVGALPAGDYDVVIDGTVHGTLTVTGAEPDSTGTVVFSTEPDADELLLNFDVFGKTLEIAQGANVYFSDTLPLTVDEAPAPTTVFTELPLLNQGVITTAAAHIELTTDSNTLDEIEVELGGVPAGDYDFKVGGVTKGTITVTEVDGITSGVIVFANDGVALPLDFDPTGQTVTIEQGTDVLLSRPL